ncbi:MAG: cupin domain-containing protein [Nitrospinota bacterium]|nr:cupin domain-containing protein [Nitrospinota bacterium]
MQAYNWDDLPPHDPGGRVQRVVAAERITILRQTIFAGHALSGRHSHPEEQVTIVLEGKARFACEDDETTLGPGGVVVFPPDKEHSTENVGDGDLVLEEVFSPGPDRLNKLAPERPQ